jgi:hypothetical protein
MFKMWSVPRHSERTLSLKNAQELHTQVVVAFRPFGIILEQPAILQTSLSPLAALSAAFAGTNFEPTH